MILIAWAIEVSFGWPDWLYQRIRHPVVWLGAVINTAEGALNCASFRFAARYCAGTVTTVFCVSTSGAIGWLITDALPDSATGLLLQAVIASSLIASRSLYEHVARVASPLHTGDIVAARASVADIVGRDCSSLDESAIVRASLETLAENASDGVVAPVFWGLLLGLPGIAAYKAINTLDSMIGHRSARFYAFGGFAAKLDDLANIIPARLTALVIAAVVPRRHVVTTILRDAPRHRSPNAGWPEAAMAAVLSVRLSGPRSYSGARTTDAWLNAQAPDPGADDLSTGLTVYCKAMTVAALLVAGVTALKLTL